ncbi:OmpA family protein [Vibrio sp. ZSDZ65]|uniref:OmpA family protein n=1 Tax=Vibrio qingdaonensis TaxID=2829491 RepID=A0A9X3CJN0_9VIBR|nr:OmpA family protein [Vibrio qingdaonensis]MCW8344682.1 OmpA family protein [Vibrio qingdaonensis]
MLPHRFYILVPMLMLGFTSTVHSVESSVMEYCSDANGEIRYTTEIGNVIGIGQHHAGFLQIEQVSNDDELKQALLAASHAQLSSRRCQTYISNKGTQGVGGGDNKHVARLQFGFDNAHLSPIARQSLNRVAQDLAKQKVALQVEGHTDSVGTEQYNQGLGLERAVNTADVLFFQGVKREKVVMTSFGELKPIATNSTSQGRATNRRVDILLSE